MSDEESHSESGFYYPKDEKQAKTEQNSMSEVITHEDENFGNSEEESQKFGPLSTKLCLVASIASPGSFWFSENDLE